MTSNLIFKEESNVFPGCSYLYTMIRSLDNQYRFYIPFRYLTKPEWRTRQMHIFWLKEHNLTGLSPNLEILSPLIKDFITHETKIEIYREKSNIPITHRRFLTPGSIEIDIYEYFMTLRSLSH